MDASSNITNTSSAPLLANSTQMIKQFGASHVVVIIMLIFAIIFMCGGNTLVILSVCLSPELHTITNLFVVNLACADILVAAQPILTILQWICLQLQLTKTMCMTRMFCAGLSTQGSLVTLTGELIFFESW